MARLVGGRYKLGPLLGMGGIGSVYHGTNQETGQPVAIKSLNPGIVTSNPQVVERFIMEGKALRQLDHPNIVKMLGTFIENGDHHIVMEYVSGGSLRTLMDKQPQLPLERVLEISLDLADALTRAHRLDIIHRDLKPANILLAEDGTPRLADFGVARISKSQITEPGRAVGTLAYLSPEACNGKEIDGRADIWAFGVLLFEMLAGHRPFEGQQLGAIIMEITTQPTPDLEAIRADIPVALVDLVYRMLEKNRGLRIPSVRQVGAELEAIMHGYKKPERFVVHTEPSSVFHTPPPPAHRPKHNLPPQASALVGREAELSELVRLVNDRAIRLITIVGPGGMGKTRLALEIASQYVDTSGNIPFPNGVYFVKLASINSPDHIVRAIADVANFHFSGERETREEILDYLRNKQLLLVLDNFEHLLEGATLVSEILQAAPRVSVVTTSREPLHLQEELLLRIEGLHFPDWDTAEDALEYGAVKLFMLSAQRAQPGFQLGPGDLPHVARICRLVQGMPLGILLAAGWTEILSPQEIADEITRSLDFLQTQMRDVPERHRSIRAVLDHSWDLLTEDERQIFAGLAVFRGGFTRDAAQRVTGASLRQLSALVNKSLLRREPEGRFYLHPLLRQYTDQQLRQFPERIAIMSDAHCVYYAEFLTGREADLTGGQMRSAMDDIENEFENIRKAWDWAIEHQKVRELRDMAYPFEIYCNYHSRYLIATDTLKAAVESVETSQAADHERDEALAYIWPNLGWLYVRLGQIDDARQVFEASRGIFVELELVPQEGLSSDPWTGLSICESILGNYQEAEAIGEDALQLHRKNSNQPGQMMANYVLTSATIAQGKYDLAQQYAQQACDLSHEIGNRWFSAICLNDLGNVAFALGNYADAKRHYQASYDVREAFENPGGMANALNSLGRIAILEQNFANARQLYEQSLALYRDVGDRGGLATALDGLGNVALATEAYDDAKMYFNEALESVGTQVIQLTLSILIGMADLYLRTAAGDDGIALLALAQHHPTSDQMIQERAETLLAQQRAQTAPDVFAAAAERGKALDLEAVVQGMLEEPSFL